jgi:O-antigen ligase
MGLSRVRRAYAQSPVAEGPIAELFSGVTWTPEFVAFLYYLFAVITFYATGADIAAVSCIVFIILSGQPIQLPRPLIWFAVFLAWALLTVALSISRAESWDAWWTLLKVFLVAMCCVNVVRTKKQWNFIMAFSTGCFLLFPFRGAMINYFGGNRLFGRAIWNYVYANPNDLAVIAILFAAFAIALSGHYKARFLRIGCYGCAFGFLLLVFFTQSRGALLGIALTGMFALAGMKQRMRTLLSGLAVAVVVGIFAPSSVWDRLSGLSKVSVEGNMKGVDQEGSAEQRFQIMQVAVAIAVDHPVFGVGIGTYHLRHEEYAEARRSELPIAFGKRDAHNTYLRLVAETGLVGLGLFFAMMGSVVNDLRNLRRQLPLTHPSANSARWLGLGLLAYFAAGTFGSFAYLNVLYIAISFITTLAALSRQSTVPSRRNAAVNRRWRQSSGNGISTPAGHVTPARI